MSEEDKTQEQIEEEAYNEATAAMEGEDAETPEKETGEEEEKEEDKETAKEPPEEEKVDWEKEAEKYKKEAEANKRFADDQARKRAETEAKAIEKEKEKEAEPETPPEEVAAFFEEYPEAQKAIDFVTKKGIKSGIDAYNTELKKACGGKDPAEFIREMVEYKNQAEFERTVMIGYYDSTGKHVPGHPDVVAITRDSEFHNYVEEKIKEDSSVGSKLNDPEYTIKFISGYKDAQMSKAAEKGKQKQKEKKEEIDEQISGADKDVTKKAPKSQPDPYDEDKAYEEGKRAVEQL